MYEKEIHFQNFYFEGGHNNRAPGRSSLLTLHSTLIQVLISEKVKHILTHQHKSILTA